MPDRVLRDELWESDRWLTLLTDSDRLSFITAVVFADSFGNLEGGRRLHRRIMSCTQVKTTEGCSAVLSHLCDADLLRRYEVDGRELFHVPRFRSPENYLVRKVPPSPWCNANAPLGKHKRLIIRGLAKNLLGMLPERNPNVSAGVGVGVGVGVNQETPIRVPAAPSAPAAPAFALKPSDPVASEPAVPAGFAAFWSAYPNQGRRKNKAACIKFWRAQGLEAKAAAIVAHVTAMAATPSWRPNEAGDHFEPEAERYLKKRNWEDGLPDGAAKPRAKVVV